MHLSHNDKLGFFWFFGVIIASLIGLTSLTVSLTTHDVFSHIAQGVMVIMLTLFTVVFLVLMGLTYLAQKWEGNW